MTSFGNSGAGQWSQLNVGGQAEAAGYGWTPETPRPEEEPAASPPRSFNVDIRRVVVRVAGADDIVVGQVQGRDPAVRLARDTVKSIEEATAHGDWPEFGDRFLRPGAIVSIDVQRAE